ncbi:hypothetical protein H6CHR_03476 [Variovorax sp. PBL-H6]|uniref:hypothetical protein n=1 Tax=Variovorax sp. PBL-H6 TaxID=434009 RepID=UPI0013196479|nr:hypothetical protein [Variovorax sp. PBL-H6]VTU30819.1 hypothetical protein H6CHR_03476 [Variovorax sp. PBL-H6]
MNATQSPAPKTDLAVTHVLAQLLERLEHSPVPVGAEQYRSVVMHLVDEFRDVAPGDGLGKLLDAYPAAAEVYENLNYQHAGLCRSGLDASLAAELAAKDAIQRVMRRAEPDATHGQG